jgi:hypothetical protein
LADFSTANRRRNFTWVRRRPIAVGSGTVRRRRGRCMHERSGRDRENRYHALVVSSLGAVQQCLGVGMPRCFCSIAFVSGFGNNLTSTASLGCL